MSNFHILLQLRVAETSALLPALSSRAPPQPLADEYSEKPRPRDVQKKKRTRPQNKVVVCYSLINKKEEKKKTTRPI